MLPSWVLILALSLVATGEAGDTSCKCSKSINKYYTELGCQPIKEAGASCPTKFDCSASLGARSKEKCHLKGKTYDPNTRLTDTDLGEVCVPECRCNKYGPQASFTCVHNDCPELFRGPIGEGCVRLYSQDDCCSTGTHCANSPAAKEAFKCHYGGNAYVVGERFYPDEEPCKTCICQTGFDGSLNGPWCSDISCGIEIHYGKEILDGCAPILRASGCCPNGWRCPSSDVTVVPAAPKKKASPNASTCTFGSLTLHVGDSLSKEQPCVECTCAVPPHVTCVQKGYC